jgi:hypothetical protein
MDIDLTDSECGAILESLRYSIRAITDYPHQEPEYKETSLRPVLAAKQKVQEYKTAIRSNGGRVRNSVEKRG